MHDNVYFGIISGGVFAGLGLIVGAGFMRVGLTANTKPNPDTQIIEQIIIPCLELGYTKTACRAKLRVAIGMLE